MPVPIDNTLTGGEALSYRWWDTDDLMIHIEDDLRSGELDGDIFIQMQLVRERFGKVGCKMLDLGASIRDQQPLVGAHLYTVGNIYHWFAYDLACLIKDFQLDDRGFYHAVAHFLRIYCLKPSMPHPYQEKLDAAYQVVSREMEAFLRCIPIPEEFD